ncbi:predicted protein [Scheffersomyces stipitis CBS 6054]|uniref:ABM domain-containing protein n=1 Tax=Scheffersomyces stipitis (strain ATCC 58785 / CBS 6054 / NBRC 10063 / NRRL Y-11545) TaxID=322104 RepID=A3LS05_PICST|nr:predicted protein [Scheffersomyces stipitis CBS 6054]ABN65823.2 predicted protein [Scheffersomyces stipitis CBS 6054]KAG2733962.1 hypothetical protein G9P44_003487 [Scheffersomyces stipitis]
MSFIAETPEPPYYVVTFTEIFKPGLDPTKYRALGTEIAKLAQKSPGYLGMESVSNDKGEGITLSYWTDRISIVNWKKNSEHLLAQKAGRNEFYSNYTTRVAKVEKSYTLESSTFKD